MCGKQKNKGLIWTTLGKPQVFPGLPYPGLQDEGLHPVEKGGLREHYGCVLGAEMQGQLGDRIGWDGMG